MTCYSAKDFKVGDIVVVKRENEYINQYAIVEEVKENWIKVKTPGFRKIHVLIPSHGEVEKTQLAVYNSL